MCGITGYIQRNESIDASVLESMNSTLTRRGPNSGGKYIDGPIGLAMRRLAIIDLSNGDQPMSSEDNNVHLVFNGEIYNYLDLRKELEEAKVTFRTRSDTETILRGYIEWGEDFVEKLHGMFAIAIFDRRTNKLHLYRDRLGIKPLYIAQTPEMFLFGSEIKAILAHPGIQPTISQEALNSYLRYRYIPSPHTCYEDINQLPPSTHTSFCLSDHKVIKTRQYWSLQKQKSFDSYEEASSEFRKAFSHAVTSRLQSDVPFGAFLSGGIDSSLIVAEMSKVSSKPISTFTIGFGDSSYDESKYARIIADKYSTDHHETIVDSFDVISTCEDILQAHDQPFGNSGALPYYFVCKETVKGLTVALSGLGADELFIGYERYLIQYYNTLLRYAPKKLLKKLISYIPLSSHKRGTIRRLKGYLDAWDSNQHKHYANIVSLFMETDLVSHARDTEEATSLYEEILDSYSGEGWYQRSAYSDIKTILLDDYLAFADRISMFHSLEVRVPFLDHHLVEIAFKIPERFKTQGKRTKHFLKDLYQDELPQEIVSRPKHGFELPIANWIRGDLLEDFRSVILNPHSEFLGLLPQEKRVQLLEEHIQHKKDNSRHIYTCFMLGLWEQSHARGG